MERAQLNDQKGDGLVTTLEGLRQSRLRFAGNKAITAPMPVVEPPAPTELWEACEGIYRATLARIDCVAGHVDRVNAIQPVPFERMELSETFSARYADLITEIDAEWLSERPDLEAFRAACDRLEALCLIELRSWIAKLRETSEPTFPPPLKTDL